MTLGEVSPQYKEVENYYVHQVNMMEGEILNVDLIIILNRKRCS